MNIHRAIREIPADLIRVQIEASDPAVSAWVAANAGSGKTHVLAQRVMRLLLDGVHPAKILCITFTKAAAANMANRIFDELRRWTALDDGELDRAIRAISDLRPDATRRALARRLFAMALETPGGLKVQTIHAFCTRLLQQFPFEANVAARFSVLDETAEAQLLNDISLNVLLDASMAPDGPLGRALATAITTASDQTFKEALGEAIRKRDPLRAWIDHAGSIEGAITSLCGALGVAADDTLEQVEKEIAEGPLLPSSEWRAVAAACKASSARDQEQCARLLAACAATGSERVEAYLNVFFDSKLEPRANLVTKPLAIQHPALAARAAQGARLPQPHRGAHHHRGRSDLPLSGGKRSARPTRLRRPDRQDTRSAWRGARGLGALQARSGHRPRADRRGAGYEFQAMGDRSAADGRVLRGRGRADGQANDFRGR